MRFTEQEMGKNVRKICEDETCTVFQVKDDSGEGLMTVYQVFKGCCLIYNDFHLKECCSGFKPNAEIFCMLTRFWWWMRDGLSRKAGIKS